MPQTVPKRPTKGPAEATVARNRRLDSSRSTSRAIETSSTLSMRACRPRKERGGALEGALPFPHRRDEEGRRAGVRPAATARRRVPRATGRTRTPARNYPSRGGICANSSVLLTMIVQHQNEDAEQAEHHDLDDDMRRPEHRQQRRFRVAQPMRRRRWRSSRSSSGAPPALKNCGRSVSRLGLCAANRPKLGLRRARAKRRFLTDELSS